MDRSGLPSDDYHALAGKDGRKGTILLTVLTYYRRNCFNCVVPLLFDSF